MKRIYYYYIALIGFFGLFILLMLWNTLLVPSTRLPIALVLIFVISPMLIPLRGFLNGNLKSCTWMCYISLFYFTHGISEAYTTPAELYYGLLEVFFSLLLCTGAGFYVYKAEKIE
ncbi:MAG: DUF2069 domain-containing protein [Methylococcales bacterium]|nr:DUF2069 domain-containing protein [Methylococcales bacterium]